MSRSVLSVAAIVVICSLIALGLGASRAAATTSTTSVFSQHDAQLSKNAGLQQIKSVAAINIRYRLTSLSRAAASVRAATDLGSDQAPLLQTLEADPPALKQLGREIAADTSVRTARSDYYQIFSDYRVYRLVLPVTAMVLTDDHIINTTGPHFSEVAQRLAASEAGADQAKEHSLLSEVAEHVSAATSAVSGLPATLETYTPADWNANHNLLNSARSEEATALADLAVARADARAASDLAPSK